LVKKKDVSGQDVLVTTVFEDVGRVTMRLALRDIGPAGSPTQPSTNNFITINRYRVVFRRADGRNQPGVDVPYPFDGAMTFTIGGQPSTAGFLLVRIQAKGEAPLKALETGGDAYSISTLAEITFWGQDQAGNETSITGTLSVNFANWGDPD
jgi:hypothetical protein